MATSKPAKPASNYTGNKQAIANPNPKVRVVASHNKQATTRYKATKARLKAQHKATKLANLNKPKLTKRTPQPKLKQAIKLNPKAIVWLATTQPVYAIGTQRYTTQQYVHKAYLTAIVNGLAICYIPRTTTNPTPYTVQASLTNTGLQHFWVLPQSNLPQAIQAINTPPKPAKPAKQARVLKTNLPTSNKPAKPASKPAIAYKPASKAKPG